MAQSSLLEKKRVGGPQMGRGPTRKRSRLDAEELLMEVTIFSLLTFFSLQNIVVFCLRLLLGLLKFGSSSY